VIVDAQTRLPGPNDRLYTLMVPYCASQCKQGECRKHQTDEKAKKLECLAHGLACERLGRKNQAGGKQREVDGCEKEGVNAHQPTSW